MSLSLARILRDRPTEHHLPTLGTALEAGDDDRLLDSLLTDLSTPVEGPVDAIRSLIHSGQYARAERGIAELGTEYSGSLRKQLEEECARSRRATMSILDRRRSVLVGRARRAHVEEAELDVDLRRLGRPAAEQRLDEWESLISAAEGRLTAAVQAQLATAAAADTDDEWDASVRACIAARDFPTAEHMLAAGPGDNGHRSPSASPHLPEWLWPDATVDEALDWYENGHTPGFNDSWRSTATAPAARQVLDALRRFRRHVDAEGVQALVTALVNLLDTGGNVRPIETVMGGFRVSLAGLSHDALPELGLTPHLELWIADSRWPPPEDGPRPVVWFVPDTLKPVPDQGVPVLTPVALFQLMALRTPSARRLNLLRVICRQMEIDDLAGPGLALPLLPSSDVRTELAWILDLLGVEVQAGVLDALMYETGTHPRALRAALESLVEKDSRPRVLTHEHLARWRGDTQAISVLRERVLTGLGDAQIAVLNLILADPSEDAAAYPPEDIAFLIWEADSAAAGRDLLTVDSVLAELTEAHLLARCADGSGYRLPTPGFAELLRESHETSRARALEALRALSDRRAEVVASLCQTLSTEALRHLSKNMLVGVRETLSRARERCESDAVDIAAIRADLERTIARVNELLEGGSVTPEEAERRMMPEDLDLTQLIVGIVHTAEFARGPRVEFEPPGRVPVFLSRHLVGIALQNIIDNAVQAVAAGGPERVRVTLTVQDDDDAGRFATVDVEDSGPGLPPKVQAIGGRCPIESADGGRQLGIYHARVHTEHSGGRLKLLSYPSDLGGAHVQITLPLASKARP